MNPEYDEGFWWRLRDVASRSVHLHSKSLDALVDRSAVVQDVMLKLIARMRRGGVHNVGGLVNRIARNSVVDSLRKTRRRGPTIPIGPGARAPTDSQGFEPLARYVSPSGEAVHHEEQELQRAALSQLSDRERRAVELCFQQGVPRAEAAETLGITTGALRGVLRQAVKKLRKILKDEARSAGPLGSTPEPPPR